MLLSARGTTAAGSPLQRFALGGDAPNGFDDGGADHQRQRRGDQAEFETLQTRLAEVISYFDCTDYVEPNAAGKGKLTFALKTKAHNPNARMSWWAHFRLLYAYATHTGPDVHGGYFDGTLSQQLMYRLACLGYDDAVAAFGSLPQLSAQCQDKQIRVLLSPRLSSKRLPPSPPPTA